MSGIYIDENNRTALYAIPSTPPSFYNVTTNTNPGEYILGNDEFELQNFHVVGIIRRSYGGGAEEFLLGVLSVFLIAILSEIVHVCLMRRSKERSRTLSPTSVMYACWVDDLSHLRNIWSYLSTVRRPRGNDTPSLTKRQRSVASLVVVTLTLALFAAEVVAVVLTQPVTVFSKEHDYNLRGLQPAGTSRDVARYIRRISISRPCVSPIMSAGVQKRNFILSVCSLFDTREVLNNDDDISDEIEVGSWYHSGGSDHHIAFGEGFFNLRLRAELLLPNQVGGARNIFFENLDNKDMDHAKYIQDRFIYASMEWACNKNFSEKTCEQLVNNLSVTGSRQQEKEIVLWRGRYGEVIENITGLLTTFKVGMNAPWRAMYSGMREFYAGAVIREVRGPTKYQTVVNDTIADGIPGLISEE